MTEHDWGSIQNLYPKRLEGTGFLYRGYMCERCGCYRSPAGVIWRGGPLGEEEGSPDCNLEVVADILGD